MLLRSVVALILMFCNRTCDEFFMWQGSISIIFLVACSLRSWSALSSDRSHPKCSIEALRDVRNFAAGMVLINLLVLLSNQTDKIILSGLVSLTDFGYYVLATTGESVI